MRKLTKLIGVALIATGMMASFTGCTGLYNQIDELEKELAEEKAKNDKLEKDITLLTKALEEKTAEADKALAELEAAKAAVKDAEEALANAPDNSELKAQLEQAKAAYKAELAEKEALLNELKAERDRLAEEVNSAKEQLEELNKKIEKLEEEVLVIPVTFIAYLNGVTAEPQKDLQDAIVKEGTRVSKIYGKGTRLSDIKKDWEGYVIFAAPGPKYSLTKEVDGPGTILKINSWCINDTIITDETNPEINRNDKIGLIFTKRSN